MLKTCKKCLKVKPIDDFYTAAQMADGHINKCKECTKADVSDNRKGNLEYYRQYDRKRYDERGFRGNHRKLTKEERNRKYSKWVSSNRAKKIAHDRIQYAIETGRLVRPDRCERCHRTATVEGHHEDYSKPLSVRWLCKECHSKTCKKPRLEIEPRKRGGYVGSMIPTRAKGATMSHRIKPDFIGGKPTTRDRKPFSRWATGEIGTLKECVLCLDGNELGVLWNMEPYEVESFVETLNAKRISPKWTP